MIAFRYTKTDGAEYLSHLDLLRHIDRTLRRAGIKVKMSEGFHPHPKIFLYYPRGLGKKSTAEYCTVEADFGGDFKKAFNQNSPNGVKCVGFKIVDENPNYAYTIESCGYTAEVVTPFDTAEYLSREQIIITDKRGRTVDIRPRIYSLEFKDGKLHFTLGCGENNLRPDLLCEILNPLCGEAKNITKIFAQGKYTDLR